MATATTEASEAVASIAKRIEGRITTLREEMVKLEEARAILTPPRRGRPVGSKNKPKGDA